MKPLLSVSAGVGFVCLFFVAVLLSGCGKKQRPMVPIRGKVVQVTRGNDGAEKEQPLDGAQVMFSHQNDAGDPLPLKPAAETREDGTFQVSTFTPNDGLPEGEYKVTVTWPWYDIVMGQKKARGDRLNGKYNNFDTTKLTATVKKGMSDLVLKVD